MIKIIRLKTGEDIIAFIEKKNDMVQLSHPLSIFIKFDEKLKTQQLYMSYWLPVNLVIENKAEISISDVLLILEPKKEFKDYYFNYLNDFKSLEELASSIEDKNINQYSKFH